jgi:hypothetical protein
VTEAATIVLIALAAGGVALALGALIVGRLWSFNEASDPRALARARERAQMGRPMSDSEIEQALTPHLSARRRRFPDPRK